MLEKILRWIVLCGVFAIPFVALLVDPSMYFPSITPKNFAFRIIVEIIFGSWITLALVYEKYRPRRSLILGTFAVLVVIMAIADAHGVDPYRSFWGNYARMDGWVTLIHVFAYLVVASVLATEKVWRLLFQVSLGVSVLVSIYGFLQIAGFLPLEPGGWPSWSPGLSARIEATLANQGYLAVYMLFHIFIAAILWYRMWKKRPSGKRLAPSLVYAAIILLDTSALLFTGSRGTIFGLIGGAFLTLIILSFMQGSRRLRIATIALGITIVALVSGLSLAKDTSFVRSIGFVDRLANTSLRDATVELRLSYMGIAWQGVKERPVLGWGQENYLIVYEKYYDPHMHERDLWNTRVHNIIFDWLIAGGFFGLMAYLSLFGATLWTLWRRNILSIQERSILTGLLAAYAIHNLALFDTVTSYILFSTVLAYIVFREREEENQAVFTQTIVPKTALPFLAAVATIVICGTVWWTNVPAFAANRILMKGLASHDDIAKRLEYVKQAIAYDAYGTPEAREQLALAAFEVGSDPTVPDEIKQEFFDVANHELEIQSAASPLDARFPFYRGLLLQGHRDYAEAEVFFQRAQALSPGMQSILFDLAANSKARGDLSQELAYYKEAYDLDPNYSRAAQLYTATLQKAGEPNPLILMNDESMSLLQQFENGTSRLEQ